MPLVSMCDLKGIRHYDEMVCLAIGEEFKRLFEGSG